MDVADAEEANLLSLLPAAVAFIAEALHGGNGSSGGGDGRVLLQCAQGVSRSAAVAAAYLMAASAGAAGPAAAAAAAVRLPGGAQLPLAPQDALAALRRACPAVAPNPGFLEQLELFYVMGCRLEESYVPYKRFLLQQVRGLLACWVGGGLERGVGGERRGERAPGVEGTAGTAAQRGMRHDGESSGRSRRQAARRHCELLPRSSHTLWRLVLLGCPARRLHSITRQRAACRSRPRCRRRQSQRTAALRSTAAASAAAWWPPLTM